MLPLEAVEIMIPILALPNSWNTIGFRHILIIYPFEEKELIARYIGWCVNREQYDLEKVLTLITNNPQETQKIMTSVAQQYVNQGVAQGVARGIRQVAKEMLFRLHLDFDTVKKATKLSQEDLKQR